MSASDVISKLERIGIRLWVENDRLYYDAPAGMISDAQADLIRRKSGILKSLLKAEEIKKSRRPVLRPVSRSESVPQSFSQRRLWFMDQLEPGSSVYNVPTALRLEGILNVQALETSLNALVERHETLRTRFGIEAGIPVQVIAARLKVPLPLDELSSLPEQERDAAMQLRVQSETDTPFDLAQGPLLRARLLRLTESSHVLVLTLHHIISDDWSMGVMMRELSALYRACCQGDPSPLPALPLQYADYAIWQRDWLQGEVLDKQLSYWRHRLKDLPVLDLPTDRPRPATQSFRGGQLRFDLPAALTQGLDTLSQRAGGTLFMTLLAAFQVLLQRYSGQDDIVVGSPIAGRNKVEVEGLIGFFVNTLVLRTDLSGDPTFPELLERVREVALGAYSHQGLPFDKLVEELQPERDMGRNPLFQVMFVLQNAPHVELDLPGIKVDLQSAQRVTARFDLTLSIVKKAGRLQAKLEYNPDLFNAATVERMAGHFRTLLESIHADPDQPVGKLPILSEAEHKKLLVDWNATSVDYPKDRTIHRLVEERADCSPDAVAVVFEHQQLTYRELNDRSNELANYLGLLGVSAETLVGIFVERSPDMVIGLLGILKAGGAYVPMDPTYPKERLAFMLEDTHAPVILTQQQLLEHLPETGANVICLDEDWQTIARSDPAQQRVPATADQLAYVMYTSGSTGRPKGVMVSHAAVCNHLFWRQRNIPLREQDCQLQKASFSFDVSVWEIFEPLIVGARLVLARSDQQHDSAYIADLIFRHQVTAVSFVPSLLRSFLQEPGIEDCTTLRRVNVGGEVLSVELQEQLFSRLDTALYFGYGPTEATIVVIYWTCQPGHGEGVIPIGRPISNTEAYILDKHLQPVPIGVPGELHISGDGLARGYLNRPELSAEKFIPNPFARRPGARLYKTGDLARYRPDGNIEFLGRLDQQVKLRGMRIELGEIEAVLLQHHGVKQSAVILREDAPDDKRLVAYVVPALDRALGSDELRADLRRKLPGYMIPSAFVILPGLPLTPTGKLDRNALPNPSSIHDAQKHYVAPATTIEKQITEIWEQVLGCDRISIHDSFFDLGGHSLLAGQAVSRISQVFQVDLTLRTLFDFTTVAELAIIVLELLQETEEI